VKRPRLSKWLVDELVVAYQNVPRKVAQEWVEARALLPLLDGLDEVAEAHRDQCVAAINAYRQRGGGVVVCSRTGDYERLTGRLNVRGAIVVEPLDAEQVEEYLRAGGPAMAGVLEAYRIDPVFRELLTTPLMLQVAALAYAGSPVEALPGAGLEVRRAQLYGRYLDRMFERRGREGAYREREAREWLARLAATLRAQKLTHLSIERIQPAWMLT